jgi:hypothetical protein
VRVSEAILLSLVFSTPGIWLSLKDVTNLQISCRYCHLVCYTESREISIIQCFSIYIPKLLHQNTPEFTFWVPSTLKVSCVNTHGLTCKSNFWSRSGSSLLVKGEAFLISHIVIRTAEQESFWRRQEREYRLSHAKDWDSWPRHHAIMSRLAWRRAIMSQTRGVPEPLQNKGWQCTNTKRQSRIITWIWILDDIPSSIHLSVPWSS